MCGAFRPGAPNKSTRMPAPPRAQRPWLRCVVEAVLVLFTSSCACLDGVGVRINCKGASPEMTMSRCFEDIEASCQSADEMAGNARIWPSEHWANFKRTLLFKSGAASRLAACSHPGLPCVRIRWPANREADLGFSYPRTEAAKCQPQRHKKVGAWGRASVSFTRRHGLSRMVKVLKINGRPCVTCSDEWKPFHLSPGNINVRYDVFK